MAKGRPRTPNGLRLIRGTASHHAAPKHAVKPRPVAPECPEWLDDDARAEWKKTVPKLVKLGVVSDVDGAVLASYCQAYARWVQAERAISRRGLVFETTAAHYRAEAPEVRVALKYSAMLRALAGELGLTPNSRARMTLPGEPPEDDFGDLLK